MILLNQKNGKQIMNDIFDYELARFLLPPLAGFISIWLVKVYFLENFLGKDVFVRKKK